jgi:choline trimethylamine-lyase
MDLASMFNEGLEKVLDFKGSQTSFKDWFLYQELKMQVREEMSSAGHDPDSPEFAAELLCKCVERMPLSIPEGAALAGCMDGAFSPSYALINPTFKVESFAGYCDPIAVYDDIAPSSEISAGRIEKVRSYYSTTPYVRKLKKVYEDAGPALKEVAFFVEPVTGHVIPDCRPFLRDGVRSGRGRTGYADVMRNSLEAAVILASRYADLAAELRSIRKDNPSEVARLELMEASCRKVPSQGASNLHEAMQSYALLWQVMCLEQAPNPYAFSAGNLDRVFQPYLKNASFEEAVALSRHLLSFFMVGARCWAISQNLLLGGRDQRGNDLSCAMTYVLLEAFRRSNCPQPALSIKVHRNTPERLIKAMGGFLFTPGHSTPSLFNDDMLFEVLRRKGIDETDIPDAAIAGCQEPLIMGKENGNTTNSWLNLAKLLELTLNDGKSLLTGAKLGLSWEELGYDGIASVIPNLEEAFWKQTGHAVDAMVVAANACVATLADVPSPFCSMLLGCLESGHDMRDIRKPGTKYSGSGCLIHGLSVVADSLVAAKRLAASGAFKPEQLLEALRCDFKGHESLQDFLISQPKYGNNIDEADAVAVRVAHRISEMVYDKRNPAGMRFQPDFSTPSTHLLYGYWVGATPDGRASRQMLGYGIDPRPGVATRGLQERILSTRKLNFLDFTGGYASHIGLAPSQFVSAPDAEGKALLLKERVLDPLFGGDGAFYVYFNIDEAAHLKKVLKTPRDYAPSGIYIMRIHGTFVNFLDLSPAIQQDIIQRLDG